MSRNTLLRIGFLLLIFLPEIAIAQQSGQLGQFDNLPQVVYANPALRPSSRINIGLPALSGVYTNHNNNLFIPKNSFETNGDGTATLNAESILSEIDEFARLNQGVSTELLHVGLEFGKHYFHLRAAERVQLNIAIPEDVFNFAAYGNVGSYTFDNNTMDFSDLDLDGIHYREYALGWNMIINEKWAAGITAKYLYGMERIQTENSSLRVRTDPETYALQSSGSYQLNTSGIYSIGEDDAVQSDTREYLLGLNNNGFGVDIGATYKLNEKLQFEFSANDFGFITWKDDIANYRTDDASFLFDGIDLTEFIFLSGSEYDDALEDEIDSVLDELEEAYGFDRTTESFTTNLNGFLRYAASYEVYEAVKSSGKAWGNIIHGLGASAIPLSVSLGYNQKVGRFLQAGAHVSKNGSAPISLGGGISLNAGPVQFYCLAENVRFTGLSKVTIVDEQNPDDQTTITYFSNPADLRVHFGINLTFGRESRSESEPMVR